MDIYERIKFKAQGKEFNLFSFGPKSKNYYDKVIYYCGTGILISLGLSFAFQTNLKSTLILGIGVPLGYLHKDLMNLMILPKKSDILESEKLNRLKQLPLTSNEKSKYNINGEEIKKNSD